METFELTFKNENGGKNKSVVIPLNTDLIGNYLGYRYKVYQYRVKGATTDVYLLIKDYRLRLAVNSLDTIAALKKEIPLSFSYLPYEVLLPDNKRAGEEIEVTLYFERVSSQCIVA